MKTTSKSLQIGYIFTPTIGFINDSPEGLDLDGHIWDIYLAVEFGDVLPLKKNPWKIEWDFTNGPLSKVLEILDTQV